VLVRPLLFGLVGVALLATGVEAASASAAAAGTGSTGAVPASGTSGTTGTTVTSGATGISGTTDAIQARDLVTSVVAAAKAQGSVHYFEWAAAGKQSVAVVGDVSATAGRQTITVRDGTSVGHLEGRWADGKVYFRGDAYGLNSYLAMPSTLARKYVQHWIVFTKADPGFAATAKQFTVAGPIAEIRLTGRLTLVPGTSTVNGVPVTLVRGRTTGLSTRGRSGTATLFIATTGSHLPVRFTGTGKETAGSSVGRVDFSAWGETVSVDAPPSAIPASQVK
jgi:hypothetical protein